MGENFVPNIGKWPPPKTTGKRVTYSNSSIKLQKERKYAIELIPVKNYKEGLMAKRVKNITNHFLKLTKVSSQKSVPQVIPMFPSMLEPSSLVRSFLTFIFNEKAYNIAN